MSYVIGVDGGGTKTEAVAFNMDGEVIKSSTKGFGNLLNNREQALNNILDAIDEIVSSVAGEDLKAIYLGLAGSEFGQNAYLVEQAVKSKFNVFCQVMNDGELALKAMLKGEDGILTIAGTGSIAFGIKDNKSERAGGWGNLLGDEGSAYKIAVEALKIMIHEYDYNLPTSDLNKKVLEYLKLTEVSEIVEFVYSSTKDDIAAIGKIVSELAEKGDSTSERILINEGIELAKTTECVYKKLNFNQCYVGLVGGAIRKSKILREAFEDYLIKNTNIINFIDDDISPAKGAYYIYRKLYN